MKRNFFWAPALSAAFLCSCVFGQDQPSLGDIARKQRKENATTSTPHASHVVTNDDIPQKMILTSNKPSDQSTPGQRYVPMTSTDLRDRQAKSFQDSIRMWKQNIAALKARLADLEKQAGQADQPGQNPSGGSSGACGTVYRQACNNARRLQAEIDYTKAQIDVGQKSLEQIQERVRKMGFGDAVYDPD